MIFYDTCSLLNRQEDAFNKEPFIISSITLKEIEDIKNSYNKDSEIKYRARNLTRLLLKHEGEYQVAPFIYKDGLDTYSVLDDNNDSKIILTAFKQSTESNSPIDFITKDLLCYHIAKSMTKHSDLLKVHFDGDYRLNNYTGYTEICFDEDQLSHFYEVDLYAPDNKYQLLDREYLIIKNKNGGILDKYCYDKENDMLSELPYTNFKSRQLGEVKPKDAYQSLAMDSLRRNKITMLRGAAGTGKSWIAMSYLFDRLERGKIDKIIIFCNTVATAGSARLGYYPGSREDKLMDSQIGNFLESKIGDKSVVKNMISNGQLVLLPMSDIRGYDTTGMNAGIYITEAQNLSIELMKLALQRIGEDSFCILDGDEMTQVDSPEYAGSKNGMRRVSEVFRGTDIYGEVLLKNIYRSKIAKIAQEM